MAPERAQTPWWRDAVGYEVYLRSFADTTGNGIGDLDGVRERLGYLRDLGVDYVWLSPFFPSPQCDHGYDVADYTDVDADHGSLDDVEALLTEAHAHGLRVLIDLVPNHSSHLHPWFQEALGGRDARTRDYYIWRDPAPDGGPPNNWVSHFGGPAWTWHEATGQYYLHLFLPEQPDLNWANPSVRAEFDEILRFWLERGVDGFRIDTAHLLAKDPGLRDNPPLAADDGSVGASEPQERFEWFDHRYDRDQPDVVDIYHRWHRIAEPYGAMLLGEVYLLDCALLARYVEDCALDVAFCFPALKVGWDAKQIHAELSRAASTSPGRLAWPLSSHDDPRAAARFGGGQRGARRALAYLTLLVGLPGTTVLLQGDELGLDGSGLPSGSSQDPVAIRNHGAAGRDSSRTPMPWSSEPGFGFTTDAPWLAFPSSYSEASTVRAQQDDPASQLTRTSELLAIRRQVLAGVEDSGVHWLDGDPALVAYRRGDLLVALNTGDEPSRLVVPTGEEPATLTVRYTSADLATADEHGLVVPGDAAVIATWSS